MKPFLFWCWKLFIYLFTFSVPQLLQAPPSCLVYPMSVLLGTPLHKSVIKETAGECGNPKVEGLFDMGHISALFAK